MLTNYHSHCNFCDGSNPIEDYVNEAIAQGLSVYGFSSHTPLPFRSSWSMQASQINEYFERIEKLKVKHANKITLLKSFEIDYIDTVFGPKSAIFKNLPLDYTVGSVHYLNKETNGYYFCIDGNHDEFKQGLDTHYNGNIQALVKDYYLSIRNMALNETPTIVGHLDKIKIHNYYFPYFEENETWYKNEITETLNAIKKSGAFVEINTRGFYKNNIATFYPSKAILEEIFELKIPIVLNSDAHNPSEITLGYKEAIVLLKEIGFATLKNYQNGTWIDTPILEVETQLSKLSERLFVNEVRK